MTPPARTLQLLQDIAAEFGISPQSVHDIRSGRVNKHWRIVTADATYALRRYHPSRTPEAISFEHDVLAHLTALGWPVAAPLTNSDGTFIRREGSYYSLFPFLAGRPAPYGSLPHLRIKGALLAKLHEDISRWRPPGQRDGFGRVWELDVYVRASTPYESLSDLLAAFRQEQPELAQGIRVQKYAVLRDLARHGYGDLPDRLGHFDFHHDNLLFQRATLSGLLDFDLVHRDARVADIASAIALDCLETPGYDAVDPAAMQAFLTGYLERGRLDEHEAKVVVPLIRAHTLWLVVWRLGEWAAGSRDAVPSIERSLSRRFPGFAQRRAALERVVADAIEGC